MRLLAALLTLGLGAVPPALAWEVEQGGGMEGTFLVLEQFQQGVELRVQVNGTDPTFTTDLRGSGAARLAILEQRGF